MTIEELKDIGTKLGLEVSHNVVGNGKGVCFNVANGQRSIVYTDGVYDHIILRQLGDILVTKGKILKKLEINRILSITSSD